MELNIESQKQEFLTICRASIQRDGLALIVVYNLRIGAFAAYVRCCVHVGDESDCRNLFAGVGRDDGHDIAVFIHCSLLHTERFQLLNKCKGEILLPRGAWKIGGIRIGLGVHCNVFEKTIFNIHMFTSIIYISDIPTGIGKNHTGLQMQKYIFFQYESEVPIHFLQRMFSSHWIFDYFCTAKRNNDGRR